MFLKAGGTSPHIRSKVWDEIQVFKRVSRKNSKTFWKICVLKAIAEIKEQYFTAFNKEEGWEPSLGLFSVTDATARSIGQLLACSLCQGGPGQSFSAPWVNYYLAGGVKTVLLYCKNLKIFQHENSIRFTHKYVTKNY